MHSALNLVVELLALPTEPTTPPTCPACGAELHLRREGSLYYALTGLQGDGSPVLAPEPHLLLPDAQILPVYVCLSCGETALPNPGLPC